MRTLIDGATAGMIGALTVAGWFLMLDVDRGQPFATPALLGAVLFHGARDVIPAGPEFWLVAEYSLFHFAAFLAFGVMAAWLISAAEQEPGYRAGVLTLFICFEVFFLALIGIVSAAVLETLVWWRIIMANFLATATMFGFFSTRYPGLSHGFRAQLWRHEQVASVHE
ncbi:MAG: hypothetical protein ABSD31_17110 [Candidatus Binataceae bacterium]